MSVDLKRVRDAHDDASSSPASKKRLYGSLGGSNGAQSPMSSSAADADDAGMEDWMRVVETHRKEAIFRQMLEYKRASRDAANKVRELEAQKRRLEASEHAVEVCWSQLVSVIQDLVGKSAGSSLAAASDHPDESRPDLTEAIAKRSTATQQLVSRFVEAAKQGNVASSGELEKECARLLSETSSLRAINKTLQSDITAIKSARDQAQSSLSALQKKNDRQQMQFDKAQAQWAQQGQSSSWRNPDGASTPGLPNGPTSGNATPNGHGVKSEGSSKDVKPLLDTAGALLVDTSSLERLAETRLAELQKVAEDNTALTRELDRLRQLALNPSEDALRSAPFFQIYLRKLAAQASDLSASRARYLASENKLDDLRNQNLAFRDAVVADGRAEAEALRQQVGKQNADLARLRGQRDDIQAELAERRAREENALGSGTELEALAKAQGERIGTLVSEVRRLKGRLGAEGSKGERGYLDWLNEGNGEVGYVESLEVKVRDLETRLRAMPDQSSDTDPRAELARIQQELERYNRILGSTAEVDDLSAMATRLEKADEEMRVLQLRLEESALSTNSLYTEVETLAKLSDTLTAQLSSKSFDMREADNRMARLATEKAKADNKYFQAMRTKEATEAECRTAQRSVEKQARLLEKALEVEKALQGQVAAQEKALTGMKNELVDLQGKWVREQEGARVGEMRLSQAQASLAEANSIMQQRVTDAAAERAERLRYQEEAERSAAQVAKLKARQETLLAASAGQGMSAAQVATKEDRDKLLKLLRCSTCEQNLRDTMVTKCGHTFCKDCLNSRISSRQRKCPACGLGFAKEDIQQMYFQ